MRPSTMQKATPNKECHMKAAFIEGYGGPEVLQFGEMPDPAAAAGEVVVDIVAASVNGADWKVREGQAGPVARFPYILGRDFSGVVAALGEGVTDLRIGDEVFGVCDAGQEGAYAEKIALRAGETILIQGGAGGVASFAIQLAKHLGARVITTASAANHDYLRGIGADEIIDYHAVDFTKVVKDCDAVFDTVGGDVAQRSFAVLKPGGRAAFIASGAQAPKPERSDVTALRPHVGRDRPHLERIVALVAQGAVHPPEVTRYRLSEAVAAHRLSESRHFRGKLVFLVR